MAIGYCVAFVLLPTGIELFARARGFARVAVIGLLAAELLGVVVIGAGLIVLAYDGSIQDYGERPARTLGTAIPLLAAGALIVSLPWWTVLRRRSR